ncbi:MAG: HDIG domain-containing protein [Candidatus Dependentiae bacterium]|nr:HDIG domain-containing protein [Candidatus Dependentiae bacterium]
MVNKHTDSLFQVMIQRRLALVLNKYPLVIKIAHAINALGGRTLLVGGAPRDLVLGVAVKDLDIEVHGLSIESVETVLRSYGPVSTVGKSFGVLRIHGLDVDWSLPRSDNAGRKPQVTIDPSMSLKQAFMRRDVTMNAMGIDVLTVEFIDFFGGLQDIQDKVLRVPNEHLFKEDPLRFYRVMHFVGRFEMVPDEQLNRLCASMDISAVSVERIEQEFEKLLLKSRRPSLGIRWLQERGRLVDIIPELAVLHDVPQDKQWHPEGNVFEHSMQALDACAHIESGHDDNDTHKKLISMYAALLHDIGKATTTQYSDGRWRSVGHEHAGAVLVGQVLRRITYKKDLVTGVKVLVKYHMVPMQLIASDAPQASYKRLAVKLAPYATLHMLGLLCLADKRGRNPVCQEPLKDDVPEVTLFVQCCQKAQVLIAVEKPLLLGRDLVGLVASGPEMGRLLKCAYNIQLDEGVTDKELLKKRVLALV